MDYALSQLVSWARRAGGDRITAQRDSLVTDGTNQLVLNNEGNIAISQVQLAGSPLDPSSYTLDNNIITFDATPASETAVIVVYTQSTYTDDEVTDFLLDSAKTIKSELSLPVMVLPSGYIVRDSNPIPVIVTDPVTMQQTVEKLIAIKAGINIREDIANSAAGDAIMVKDGDTTIDTGKTAAGNEAALKRMNTEYLRMLTWANANIPKAAALNEMGGIVGCDPWAGTTGCNPWGG